jgi:DEAD/DEAH box helicase domain-containing protein
MGTPATLSDEPRIFVFDNYPGGIGFSQPLYEMHGELAARTRLLIAGCACLHGCPTCVGPIGNTGPLAKMVALRILDLLAAVALPASGEEAADDAARPDAPALDEGRPA